MDTIKINVKEPMVNVSGTVSRHIALEVSMTKVGLLSEGTMNSMTDALREQNTISMVTAETVTPESPLDITMEDCGCTFHLDHLKDIEEGKDIPCPHGENRWLVKWDTPV